MKSNCSTYSIEENEQKRLVVLHSNDWKYVSWGYPHYTAYNCMQFCLFWIDLFVRVFFFFILFILWRIGQWSLSLFAKHYLCLTTITLMNGDTLIDWIFSNLMNKILNKLSQNNFLIPVFLLVQLFASKMQREFVTRYWVNMYVTILFWMCVNLQNIMYGVYKDY